MSKSKRVTIASIADIQFRFNIEGSGFDVAIVGAEGTGREVEVTLTGQMAMSVPNGVLIAMEQNALCGAAIAAGAQSAGPEIRTIPATTSTH